MYLFAYNFRLSYITKSAQLLVGKDTARAQLQN